MFFKRGRMSTSSGARHVARQERVLTEASKHDLDAYYTTQYSVRLQRPLAPCSPMRHTRQKALVAPPLRDGKLQTSGGETESVQSLLRCPEGGRGLSFVRK